MTWPSAEGDHSATVPVTRAGFAIADGGIVENSDGQRNISVNEGVAPIGR